ncbi:hypothetical protein [Haloarcula onubensis]|uniref:Uncharacterized protein n=1 Tax=Haloarcula onubensis TaxID=2950539 RepID=A0ABU2FPX2_9EURY|nr:hypothetical protein [Halomicroarcula sp. S3CR25-11]MDS0282789.1 hypothetical protein [Halomicroarcula sp. S3CR25-11]
MDRISALRNVEEALAAFESGECSLSELEADVRGVLRTYAADFEGDLRAYRASSDGPADGLVVLAASAPEARDRVAELVEEPRDVTVSPVE